MRFAGAAGSGSVANGNLRLFGGDSHGLGAHSGWKPEDV